MKRPIHPGEILLEDFLKPLDMSAAKLAAAIGVPPNRVSSIISGARNVTPDTALRLAKALGTTPLFWLNLQQAHDLRRAEENVDLRAVKRIHAPMGYDKKNARPLNRTARRAVYLDAARVLLRRNETDGNEEPTGDIRLLHPRRT